MMYAMLILLGAIVWAILDTASATRKQKDKQHQEAMQVIHRIHADIKAIHFEMRRGK